VNPPDPFRTLLIAGFLLVIPVATYYRLRSQATGEKLDRRQEGWFILLTLRPVGAALWLGLIAWLINPAWMAWSALELPDGLRWTAAGVWALAAALFLWTLRSLGKNLTDTVVTRREHTLVTHGPYRWVRHPFYVSAGSWAFSGAVMAANWFLCAAAAAFILLIVVRTRIEEANLLARFGTSYQSYMDRTGRFLPKF
jgi:protein-S-isoprenylcysteine O-methyltransferase Ste14